MGRRLFSEIERERLKFAFHSWGTALEVMAAAQLGVCWPESVVEWLEYPCYSTPSRAGMYPHPLAAEVLKDPLQLDHGDLILPKVIRIDDNQTVGCRKPEAAISRAASGGLNTATFTPRIASVSISTSKPSRSASSAVSLTQ